MERLAQSTEFNGQELIHGDASTLTFQVGINTTSSDRIDIGFRGLSVTGLGLTTTNIAGVSTSESLKAIDRIDNALQLVTKARTEFGATINRLGIAIANTQTIRTNLSAAASAIRDVDIAMESANLARSQVLLQAGTSVLAQANQSPQLALSLLG